MEKILKIGFKVVINDEDNLLNSVEDFDEHVIDFYGKTRNYLTDLFAAEKFTDKLKSKYPDRDSTKIIEAIKNNFNETLFLQVVKQEEKRPPSL